MRTFGLIGKPLTHSFSKTYFADKFLKEEVAGTRYQNFELQQIEDIVALVQSTKDLNGLNVTIPYKEQVIPFLTKKNEVVEEIGACNCIKIEEGRLYGFNTDVIGFRKSLEPLLQSHHKKALVLGTGGAAKAVEYSLRQINIEYTLVSRRQLENSLGYEDIDEAVLKEHLLIINTTPVGMYPKVDDAPPLPYQFISSQHLLFDLIYNPPKTKFLQKGEEQGATISNGHEMLILQAEESWRIWNSPLDL